MLTKRVYNMRSEACVHNYIQDRCSHVGQYFCRSPNTHTCTVWSVAHIAHPHRQARKHCYPLCAHRLNGFLTSTRLILDETLLLEDGSYASAHARTPVRTTTKFVPPTDGARLCASTAPADPCGSSARTHKRSVAASEQNAKRDARFA